MEYCSGPSTGTVILLVILSPILIPLFAINHFAGGQVSASVVVTDKCEEHQCLEVETKDGRLLTIKKIQKTKVMRTEIGDQITIACHEGALFNDWYSCDIKGTK